MMKKEIQPCRLFEARLLKDHSKVSGIWDNGKFHIPNQVKPLRRKDLINISFTL